MFLISCDHYYMYICGLMVNSACVTVTCQCRSWCRQSLSAVHIHSAGPPPLSWPSWSLQSVSYAENPGKWTYHMVQCAYKKKHTYRHMHKCNDWADRYGPCTFDWHLQGTHRSVLYWTYTSVIDTISILYVKLYGDFREDIEWWCWSFTGLYYTKGCF